VHVPRVHAALSSDRVLTMEYVRGAPVADAGALRAAGIDPPAVARLVAQACRNSI
jgi:predicted unusual protein kinase regulating ubiquinone biosynthesis (AarF/ABC1/UbiB family)